MNPDLEKIFEEVTRALDLGGLSRNEQEEILSQIGQAILEQITISSYEKLSPENREKLNTLDKEDDAGAVYAFLEEQIPDFKNFARGEARTVVDDFLKAFKAT